MHNMPESCMVLQEGLLQFTAVLRRAKGDYARMSVNLTPPLPKNRGLSLILCKFHCRGGKPGTSTKRALWWSFRVYLFSFSKNTRKVNSLHEILMTWHKLDRHEVHTFKKCNQSLRSLTHVFCSVYLQQKIEGSKYPHYFTYARYTVI